MTIGILNVIFNAWGKTAKNNRRYRDIVFNNCSQAFGVITQKLSNVNIFWNLGNGYCKSQITRQPPLKKFSGVFPFFSEKIAFRLSL